MLVASALGVWSLARLPIDAVPDITNNQVQINTVAPALSPVEIEKQVTFRIETALAGMPGLEYTRSLSRNGFSQVTAVFSDKTDIYFARQQISERLLEVRSSLPPGAEPRIGPDLHRARRNLHVDGRVSAAHRRRGEGRTAGLARRRRLSHAGRAALDQRRRARRLSAHGAGLDHPAAAQGRAGVAGVDAIGGYVKQYQVQPDPSKLIALGLSFGDIARAIEANNVSRGASTIERNGEGFVVRAGGRVETARRDRATSSFQRAQASLFASATSPRSTIGGETRTGSASENGQRSRGRHGADADRREQPHRGGRRRCQDRRTSDARCRRTLRSKPCSTAPSSSMPPSATVAKNLAEGALLVIARAVPAARQFPRGADHRAGDPDRHADDGHRHVAGADQRQPDEPRRARFRPDRRWRRHHHREQPCAILPNAAARAGPAADFARSGWKRCVPPPRR